MKRTILIVIAIVVTLLAIGRVGYWQIHYNREGVVTGVTEELVTITDFAGNDWQIDGCQLAIGDRVVMRMNTHGTDGTIYDDIIDNVKVIQ